MTTAVSTDTTTVHWTQDGLQALVEGRDGHGDTCAPIAMLSYRAVAHHVPQDNITLDASRAELIAWGLMDTPGEPGMTVAAVATALRDRYSSPPVKTVDYSASLDLEQFHQDLKAAMLAHQAVIMETSDAAALPGNQAGVQYHFVLFWGIDSTHGYFCANGDLVAGIEGTAAVIPPVWYTIDEIAASKPCGYIVLPAVSAPDPTPPPPPAQGAWPRAYTVTPADLATGLPGIALAQYGDPALWPAIWELNREKGVLGSDPAMLRNGMQLEIPEPPAGA